MRRIKTLLTMRNNRHISDIGSLVHELTDLPCCQSGLSSEDKALDWTATYLFDSKAVGELQNISKQDSMGPQPSQYMHVQVLYLDGCNWQSGKQQGR